MAFSKVDKKFVSSIEFLDQREILNEVLDITNEDSTFLDIMEMCGRSEETAQPDYHHFVNEELYGIGEVTGVPVGSGTASVEFDLTAATKGDCREGTLIQFPAGAVGLVVTKDDATVTVTSVDGSNIAVAAADKLSFFSNASGEGAAGPAPFRKGQVKYWNQVHSFDGAYEVTDIEAGSRVETSFKGSDFYMVKGQHEAFKKFQADVSFGLFFSRISDANFKSAAPTLIDKNGNPVQTTRGMNQYIEDMGLVQTPSAAGTVTLADFNSWEKALNKRRAPKEYVQYVGGNKKIEMDDFLQGLGSTPELKNARFSVDGRHLDLGMDSYKMYTRTYHMKHLGALDHKNVVNFTGSAGFENYSYFVPEGKIKTVSGNTVDYCGIRHMNQKGGGKYLEIHTGGLAPRPTNDVKNWKITYYGTMGLDIVGADFFGMWDA